MSSRYSALVVCRRFFSDNGPKKFKNFSEIAQGLGEEAAAPKVAKAAQEKVPKSSPARPPAPEPVVKAKSAASPSSGNRAAGDEYLVPEYARHTEYSFYDLNTDMSASRIGQPRAERK